jgi:hypothetical protein
MFYTSQEKIEAYLGRTLTADELIYLEDSIDNITEYIKAYTGRNWLTSIDYVEEEARIYDGNGARELYIDDYTNLSKIEFLDGYSNAYETIPATDYSFYPLGSQVKDSIYVRFRNFPNRRSSVRVTAEFHSGLLPAGVRAVATALMGEFIASKQFLLAPFTSESIEGYSYSVGTGQANESQAKIKGLFSRLDPYRRIQSTII